MALAEYGGKHRLAPQDRGVDFETIYAIDIEVLGLGQGEEVLEHVRCIFAQREGGFDAMPTCPAEPNYRMPSRAL